MKKSKLQDLMLFAVLGSLLLSQVSCAKKQAVVNGGHASSSQTGVNDILQSGLNDQTSVSSAEPSDEIVLDFTSLPAYTTQSSLPSEELPIPEFTKNDEGVEVDLTVLSSGAVYATVFDMVSNPDRYRGKVVKMRGQFQTAYDEATGVRYYACVIQDATQCCAQGIEFEFDEPGTFPDDFPETGAECTVIGVFDTYDEGDYRYATLRHAKMTF